MKLTKEITLDNGDKFSVSLTLYIQSYESVFRYVIYIEEKKKGKRKWTTPQLTLSEEQKNRLHGLFGYRRDEEVAKIYAEVYPWFKDAISDLKKQFAQKVIEIPIGE